MIKKVFLIMLFLISMVTINANAVINLDDVTFDPAIIAAGDEVDVIIQYSVADGVTDDTSKIADRDYTFKVELMADDSLTRDYVTIQDELGDNVHGSTLLSGDFYKKRFTVKIANDAPAGNYEFMLTGQWHKNGVAEPAVSYVRFKMPVKKEGIIVNVANLITNPSEVRPGDDYVSLETYIENVGEKDSKSVEASLIIPQGFSHSYSNNNRIWIGQLNAGQSKRSVFNVDIADDLEPGTYNLTMNFDYMDQDDNLYFVQRTIPILVKSRPYLEVIATEGRSLAGENGELQIVVQNTGTQSAESIDVRILKQNSQPFTLDVRSDYIGELKPGEKGLAVFDIGVNSDAAVKNHSFKILIRAKGDSDAGDDRIYTFNRRANFVVTGPAQNNYALYGVGGLVLVLAIFGFSRKKKK